LKKTTFGSEEAWQAVSLNWL